MINCRWGVNQLQHISAERTSKILTLFALRILQLIFSSIFWASSPRGGEETHYSRKRSFLSPSDYGEKGVPPRERKHRRRWRRRGQRRGWTTKVYVQSRRRGGSDWCAGQEAAWEWWIETKRRLRNPVAVAVRDEGRSELRDPSALRVVIIINLSGV